MKLKSIFNKTDFNQMTWGNTSNIFLIKWKSRQKCFNLHFVQV